MSEIIEYSEKVMDHFNNPRNVGEIEKPSGVGTVGNAKCGDIMRIYLDINDGDGEALHSAHRPCAIRRQCVQGRASQPDG